MTKTINDLTPQAYPEESSSKIITRGNKEYDLELEKVVLEIKNKKAKLVLLQFPDGLKPYATAVVDYLEEKLAHKGVPPDMQDGIFGGITFLIWLGDCFGACDTPNLGDTKVDLVVQFGHSEMMPSY